MYATIDRKNYQNNQYNHHILTQQEKHKQMYNKYVQNNISTVENSVAICNLNSNKKHKIRQLKV